MDALGPADIEFLRKLPITLSSEPAGNGATDTATATIELHLGRYGLYAKKDGANHRIPRDMWDRLYDGEVSYAELEKALTQNPDPRQPTGQGRAQTRAPRGRKPRS